jgi:hypothetical protein
VKASVHDRHEGQIRFQATAVRADGDRRLAPALVTDLAALDEDHTTAQRTEVASDVGRPMSRTVTLLTRVRALNCSLDCFVSQRAVSSGS